MKQISYMCDRCGMSTPAFKTLAQLNRWCEAAAWAVTYQHCPPCHDDWRKDLRTHQ